ncbi:MAG: alanine racemase [Patescibacteria group bacterium]
MDNKYKVWVEIDSDAVKNNLRFFRSRLGDNCQLFAVVKSNAYGHGLIDFSKLVANEVDGFCVDSVMEGLALRREGINKPILVLGSTLPHLLLKAAENNITITVSNFDALNAVLNSHSDPGLGIGGRILFHLKLDTGMHRQGFYLNDLERVIQEFRISNFEFRNQLKGLCTHFASAKDVNYPTYTERQFEEFLRGVKVLEGAGFNNLIKHVAATGGTLISNKYHLDAVRLGIGLYGMWPSKELEIQRDGVLEPVLSWHTIVSEVKEVKVGDYIGYDLTERMAKDGKIAILPIGYWHGLPRSLSNGVGEVLINNQRARVLGRVSMDMIVVDVSNIACQYGDRVTIIGRQGDGRISAEDVARRMGTINYEVVTGINPLIKRIVK